MPTQNNINIGRLLYSKWYYIHEGVYIQNQAFPAQDAYMSIIVGVGIHNSGLNDAHGPGPPVPNIPCALEVDWIRVYQR